MKATLMPQKSFTIPGLPDDETFVLMSEWNGLKEIRNSNNEMLVVSVAQSSFKQVFGELFNAPEPVEILIVLGTPSLIARIAQTIPKDGVAPKSPFSIEVVDGAFVLFKDGKSTDLLIEDLIKQNGANHGKV